jgi:hypothetical protein
MPTNEKNTSVEVGEHVYTLSRPYVFEDVEYTFLNLDFDALFGDDLLKINARFDAEAKNFSFVKALSLAYQLEVAAVAAKIPVQFFNRLPAKDVQRIGQRAQNFLLV